MLTYQEAQEAFNEASTMSADDFLRLIADYMPQDIVDKLMQDIIMARVMHSGAESREEVLMTLLMNADALTQDTAVFMTGFQVGWILATRALT